MKTTLLCLLLLCAITLSLYAQSGVDETLKADVLVMKNDIKNLKENVINGFNRVERNFDRQNNIIIACIGLPLAILAIGATVWGILAHRRGVRDNAQREEIETLKNAQREEIETLKAEIEILKQRHIVSP